MLVIITEDSKSGHEFWKVIKYIVFNNSDKVQVQVARPEKHKDFGGKITAVGGIGNVKTELNQQLKRLSKKKGKHIILLAIDNVKSSSKNPRGAAVHVKSLIEYVKGIKTGRIKSVENINDIEIRLTQYYCYEEIFLSFKYLLDYAGVEKAPPTARDKAVELYEIVNNVLTKPCWTDYSQVLAEEDRQFLYNKFKVTHDLKSVKDTYNREVLASLILEYITTVNKDVCFTVSKSIFETCWYLDCIRNKGNLSNIQSIERKMSKTVCTSCKLCNEQYGYGVTKVGLLLKNSLLVPQGLLNIEELKKYA